MKDHIIEGDQWTIAMDPMDKVALDQLKTELRAKSYREVIVTAINSLKPANRLYLRKFGDIEDDLPGLAGIVMNMYVVRDITTKEGFHEFMGIISRSALRERKEYQELYDEKEEPPEEEEAEDLDRSN